MSPSLRRSRTGYSLTELLMVVAVLAIVFALVAPRITAMRESSSLRAAHQELAATFSAARSAALQKGKPSFLTLSSNAVTVRVNSGLASQLVTVYGPVRFDQSLGVTVRALGDAPNVVSYNGRGMMMNVMDEDETDETFKYELRIGASRDTLCISKAGLILSKTCRL